MAEAARINSTVYVAGLTNEVDQAILHGAFIPFGEIAEVSLPKPELRSSTDPHRGFGYVEFEDPSDAEAAIDNMDGAELYGRVLTVAVAKPQKKGSERLGAKTAIWQQEGYLAEHAVDQEDRVHEQQPSNGTESSRNEDPMQGLEALDIAGPRPA